jgi:hypothetical protein
VQTSWAACTKGLDPEIAVLFKEANVFLDGSDGHRRLPWQFKFLELAYDCLCSGGRSWLGLPFWREPPEKSCDEYSPYCEIFLDLPTTSHCRFGLTDPSFR